MNASSAREQPVSWLLEDRRRLDGFRNGDAAVLSEVYRVYGLDLTKSLRQGFGFESQGNRMYFKGNFDPFDLDDVVQDTFVKAFSANARSTYDGLRPFEAYLFTIARNVIIDRCRSERRVARWVSPEDETSPVAAASEQLSPETQALDAELRKTYQDFLASLDDTNRQLWKLRFEEDASRRLVEEQTGLSAMQVRTREKKLRDELQRRLVSAGYPVAATTMALILLLVVMGWR